MKILRYMCMLAMVFIPLLTCAKRLTPFEKSALAHYQQRFLAIGVSYKQSLQRYNCYKTLEKDIDFFLQTHKDASPRALLSLYLQIEHARRRAFTQLSVVQKVCVLAREKKHISIPVAVLSAMTVAGIAWKFWPSHSESHESPPPPFSLGLIPPAMSEPDRRALIIDLLKELKDYTPGLLAMHGGGSVNPHLKEKLLVLLPADEEGKQHVLCLIKNALQSSEEVKAHVMLAQIDELAGKFFADSIAQLLPHFKPLSLKFLIDEGEDDFLRACIANFCISRGIHGAEGKLKGTLKWFVQRVVDRGSYDAQNKKYIEKLLISPEDIDKRLNDKVSGQKDVFVRHLADALLKYHQKVGAGQESPGARDLNISKLFSRFSEHERDFAKKLLGLYDPLGIP